MAALTIIHFCILTTILNNSFVFSRSINNKNTKNNELRLNHQQWYDTLTSTHLSSTISSNIPPESVKFVHLESNEIRDIQNDAFATFPQLTHLYLGNNMLTNVTFALNSLEYLDLSHNFISDEIGSIVRQFPRLQFVNLAYNKLSTIAWHFENDSLITLNLSNNYNLHDVIISSNRLEVLSLEGLKVNVLILDTPNLRKLDLRRATLGNDVSLYEICAGVLRRDFVVEFLSNDERDDSVLFSCEEFSMESSSGERTSREFFANGHNEERRTKNVHKNGKMSSTNDITTRILHDEDIVLTPDEYFKLQVIYFVMFLLIVVLLVVHSFRIVELSKISC